MTDTELIEAVAIEVMNFKSPYWEPGYYSFWFNEIKYHTPFNPLTDMNHLMMVVEKMREIGFNITILSFGAESWHIRIGKQNRYAVNFGSIGHAVCLAALEAVRQGKDA